MPMNAEIRPIKESELKEYVDAVNRGFGADTEDGQSERVAKLTDLNRCFGAFDSAAVDGTANDDTRIVGTIGSYSFPLAVPGSTDVQAAGLTRVTVSASHRRQGILRALMDAHFKDAADHGEPVSVLWASEVPIYGRFGYGLATEMLSMSFDARLAAITRPENPDTLDQVNSEEAAKLLPDIRERTRIDRPGKFGRSPAWWQERNFADPESWRSGASARRYVVASRGGEPVGYATYRHRERWTDALSLIHI